MSENQVFYIVFVTTNGNRRLLQQLVRKPLLILTLQIYRALFVRQMKTYVLVSGVDFQIKTMMVDDRCIAIQLWDTAGQERYSL